MTIEEAIKILKQYLDMDSEVKSEYLEAQRMAIKVLEQQPCEDCISRQETIEWLKKVTVTDGITFKTGFKQILYDIEQMPSVTPKQKVGKWINQYQIYGDIAIDMKVCSECRYEFSYDVETGISNANYCPNCGAKMEVENE